MTTLEVLRQNDGSWRARRPHLSDDEAVAKMGHLAVVAKMGHPSVTRLSPVCGLDGWADRLVIAIELRRDDEAV
jgi:hypothetical protein